LVKIAKNRPLGDHEESATHSNHEESATPWRFG
jgi:hypothetical protein